MVWYYFKYIIFYSNCINISAQYCFMKSSTAKPQTRAKHFFYYQTALKLFCLELGSSDSNLTKTQTILLKRSFFYRDPENVLTRQAPLITRVTSLFLIIPPLFCYQKRIPPFKSACPVSSLKRSRPFSVGVASEEKFSHSLRTITRRFMRIGFKAIVYRL